MGKKFKLWLARRLLGFISTSELADIIQRRYFNDSINQFYEAMLKLAQEHLAPTKPKGKSK